MSKMNQVYGVGQALINSLPPPQFFESAPTSTQTNYEIGQIAFTGTSGSYSFYIYAGAGVWELLDISTGALDTLTGDSGTAVPTAGNIKIAGTAAQVATSASGSTVTLSLIGPYTPATYTAHGVLIGEGASSIAATASGSAGQLLTSGGASADPVWTTATFPATATSTGTILRSNGTNWVASTDTYPDTSTAGALIAATATNTIGQIADVATGQALMSGGVGIIPAYTGSPSFSGSVTAATTITATAGAITATNGNFVKGTAGNKDVYSSVGSGTSAGANSAGTVTLSSGTATVSTTAVTASSIIRIYRQSVGATGAAALGILSIGTITASTSFVINAVQAANATANQASDVSIVAWEIVN
jgi:hypothetical protein